MLVDKLKEAQRLVDATSSRPPRTALRPPAAEILKQPRASADEKDAARPRAGFRAPAVQIVDGAETIREAAQAQQVLREVGMSARSCALLHTIRSGELKAQDGKKHSSRRTSPVAPSPSATRTAGSASST
jgi:hypothetical protein